MLDLNTFVELKNYFKAFSFNKMLQLCTAGKFSHTHTQYTTNRSKRPPASVEDFMILDTFLFYKPWVLFLTCQMAGEGN
jgi:hypothetical protein